jgi:predicted CopG family antitoxin
MRTIYLIIATFTVRLMTTISVTDDVKQKLLKVASELQIKLGHRVDLNEALRFLVDEREKNPQMLEEACKPMPGAREAIEELQEERKLDETRLERKISHRRQRSD